MLSRTALAVFATAFTAGAAFGHHGWGSYDVAKKFTINAPVETLSWQNPHAHVTLKYEGANWDIVLAPVSRMTLRGLSEEMIKVGTPVAVEGYPSTKMTNEMRAERITVDGKTFELR